jgi:hypothetical protein
MAKSRKQKIVENFGKILVDLGKLTFASIVLGSIFNSDINKAYLLLFGSLFCVVFILGGVLLITSIQED